MRGSTGSGLSKVPEVTPGFRLIKIAASTLGETGGDAVTMSLGLGYLAGTAIFAVAVAVTAQASAQRFHPLVSWNASIATTTAGTVLADFADRSLGIGHTGGSLLLFAPLMATLGLWHCSLGSVSVEGIRSRKAEVF
ncbi:hypothetical protein QMO56_23125 [Roseomonas sp. E05]|uniref:hypothetical protein n=1 Tax=Roseomonas sp. E05 TaxID=3046310 RepID=UPI0024BB6B37|nr:hypothetical protein [Roseomonas sp. E05]MDJ0391015.1 hypothetical protein [Roseomonas sp. E05]